MELIGVFAAERLLLPVGRLIRAELYPRPFGLLFSAAMTLNADCLVRFVPMSASVREAPRWIGEVGAAMVRVIA